jgi:hypothetical protein
MNLRRAVWLSLVCAVLLSGQGKPDFSGTWKLNAGESDFSDKRTSPPELLVWTLRHEGKHVTYKVQAERKGKKNEFDADADIGGEPYESDAAGIIRFQWKGSSLAVDTLYNPGQDRETSMEEVWTLSGDGKKLTDDVVYHVAKNAKDTADVRFKRVFDKQ